MVLVGAARADEANAGSDSGEEEATVPDCHLRFSDVIAEVPDGDTAAATQLPLSQRGLTSLESLESLKSLKRLELRGNHLTALEFVEMNHALCWLDLAGNRLRALSCLHNLASLAVLDVSDNRLSRMQGLDGLAGLKALIAARNRITQIEGLSPSKQPLLETLVLSNNRITSCRLVKFKSLRKVSLGHNQLHAFPQLEHLPALAELRLNSNRITAATSALAFLPSLTILDVGNNLVTEPGQLAALSGLRKLKSLNIQGNVVAADIEAQSLREILDSLKSLEILNNRRLAGKSQNKNKKGKRKTGEEEEPAPQRPRGGKATEQPSDRRPAKASKTKQGALGGKQPAQLQQRQGVSLQHDKVRSSTMDVHGRVFEGKRSVFQDDDDDDNDAATENPPVQGDSEPQRGSAPPAQSTGQVPVAPVNKAEGVGEGAGAACRRKKKRRRTAVTQPGNTQPKEVLKAGVKKRKRKTQGEQSSVPKRKKKGKKGTAPTKTVLTS